MDTLMIDKHHAGFELFRSSLKHASVYPIFALPWNQLRYIL